jgi:hypothetical protein
VPRRRRSYWLSSPADSPKDESVKLGGRGGRKERVRQVRTLHGNRDGSTELDVERSKAIHARVQCDKESQGEGCGRVELSEREREREREREGCRVSEKRSLSWRGRPSPLYNAESERGKTSEREARGRGWGGGQEC